MKYIILIALLVSTTSYAATIRNVRILNVKKGPQNIELKVQSTEGRQGSYFFVDIVKEDPGSFEKLSHVINKMAAKNYILDLEIPSFSESPNGSIYRGERVRFIGPTERETKKPNN